MKAYRNFRTTQLAKRHRYHSSGFRFAGADTFFSEEWEVRERSVIRDQLQLADVMIDIGANQGFYSCLAASMGLHVAALEPEAGNLRFLMSNIIENGFDKLEVFPIAVSDSVGVRKFYGDGDTASLIPGWAGTRSSFAQLIPTNTMDNLFDSRWRENRIFIKMDVEGSEFDVIKGSAMLLSRKNKPNWLIETFPNHYDKDQTENRHFRALFQTFFSHNYTCSRADTGIPVTMGMVEEWVANPASRNLGGSNYLFVHESQHTFN